MKTIERKELKKMLDEDKDFFLINVLSEKSYENEHIAGSQNIHFGDDSEGFMHQANNLIASKDDEIVVYCASTECPASANAAKALEAAGYTNVRAYEGGMKDWNEAGYPVEGTGAGTRFRAHG